MFMRNYDKEPITLVDYNASFMWNTMKYTGFPLMLLGLILYPLVTGNEFKFSSLSMLIIMLPMIQQYQQAKQRKIVLLQDRIEYIESEDKLSIIDLNEPNKFQKSFQNYYYKKQNLHFLYFVFIFFFVGFLMHSLINGALLLGGALAITFALQQITKYIISDYGFMFFSSVLVQQGEEVVSIPIYKKKDYQEVQQYLISRGIDIHSLSTFFKPFYGVESGFRFFSSENKKDIVCQICRKSLDGNSFSCPHCGNPLSNEKMIETIEHDKYLLKAILHNKNDFSSIKNLLLTQYKPLGYTVAVIDKENSLMLTNATNTQTYINAKLENYELTIEAYKAIQPTIKMDAKAYLVQ